MYEANEPEIAFCFRNESGGKYEKRESLSLRLRSKLTNVRSITGESVNGLEHWSRCLARNLSGSGLACLICSLAEFRLGDACLDRPKKPGLSNVS